MLRIDPAELSAYLDGELPPERMEEVRAALADDPELRATYEQQASSHADWSNEAASAMFRPRVRVGPAPVAALWLVATCVVMSLLVLRMSLKLIPPALGVSLEATLLVVVVVGGLRRILRWTDADRDRELRIGDMRVRDA
jgi:anti-sigma factor RsiW